MKHNLLIPNKYKKYGWMIVIPSFIVGVTLTIVNFRPDWLKMKVFNFFPNNDLFAKTKLFSWMEVNMTNTIIGVLFITGALIVAFSKEKNEDEFISDIRLISLRWAVLINYLLLIIAFIFVYNLSFFTVMIYNMFTVLIIFIVRFHFVLYKYSRLNSDEK